MNKNEKNQASPGFNTNKKEYYIDFFSKHSNVVPSFTMKCDVNPRIENNDIIKLEHYQEEGSVRHIHGDTSKEKFISGTMIQEYQVKKISFNTNKGIDSVRYGAIQLISISSITR